MKELFKSIGGGILGIATWIVFATAFLLIMGLFLKGGLWLSVTIYPWLVTINQYSVLICIFILLPLAVFKSKRAISGIGFSITSVIFGLTLLIWSFLVAYHLWGLFGLLIGLFFGGIGVIPVAALAALFNAEWVILGEIILLVIFTTVSSLTASYLISKS